MKQTIKGYWTTKIRGKETGEKTSAMKCIWLAALFCFLLGILGANLIDREQLNGFGIWNTFFMEKFKYAPIRSADLFYYVLRQRIPVMAVLLLLAFANWGTLAGSVFLAWQGFAAGFLMAASVSVYGLKGILLMGTAFFPQYLLYIPLYIGVIYLSAFLRRRRKSWIPGKGFRAGRARQILLLAGICLVIMAAYITGIFLESYVNPYLLKKILKIF